MSSIISIFAAPPLVDGDPRARTIPEIVERVLGVKLTVEPAQPGALPLAYHESDEMPVVLSGNAIPPILGPGGQPIVDVTLSVPSTIPRATIADLAAEVGDAAQSFWGHTTPEAAAALIAQQTIHPHDPSPSPRGLPSLYPVRELASPDVPARLGWLVYWSAASAALLGFPDPVRDRDLLARAKRTSRGWLIELVDEPLDLDVPAHVQQLRDVYDRFPQIGGRG